MAIFSFPRYPCGHCVHVTKSASILSWCGRAAEATIEPASTLRIGAPEAMLRSSFLSPSGRTAHVPLGPHCPAPVREGSG